MGNGPVFYAMGEMGDKLIKVGRVSGVHGIKGWIKVHSYTEPRDNIFRFARWRLAQTGRKWSVEVEDGRESGKNVLVKLKGIDDRDVAAGLLGAEIAVERRALPACAPGEYYWADLEGLAVKSRAGDLLGRVDYLFANGAHDVLVLDGDGGRMIPFVAGSIVDEVDVEAGVIVVNWDASFWER